MRARVTHSLDDEFRDRTLFLWASLGVVSLLRGTARAVAPAPRRGALTLADGEPPLDGREALYALLGLVSMGTTARAQWRHLASAGAPSRRPRAGRAARVARPRALLV